MRISISMRIRIRIILQGEQPAVNKKARNMVTNLHPGNYTKPTGKNPNLMYIRQKGGKIVGVVMFFSKKFL